MNHHRSNPFNLAQRSPAQRPFLRALSRAVLCTFAAITPALAAGAADPPVTPVPPQPCWRSADSNPLTTDPQLITGSLRNGLSYVIKRHPNPRGQLSLRLHVRAGSLDETTDQTGVAALLARLVFTQSQSFDTGRAWEELHAAGIRIDRRRSVRTTFDATRYTLDLPRTDEHTIALALRFLADAAGGLVFDDAIIDKERRLLAAEQRTQRGINQRLNEIIIPQLLPDTRFAAHPANGRPGDVERVTRNQLRAYYDSWFAPRNMTLVAVGDAPPDRLLDLIARAFDAIPPASEPERPQRRVQPMHEARAIIAPDPDIHMAAAEIILIDEPLGPIRTERALRERLTAELVSEALQHRLNDTIRRGETSFRDAYVYASDLYGAMSLSVASAVGRPDQWDALLADLTREITRIRLYGFLPHELADARTEVIARSSRLARTEDTLPAPVVADSIADLVGAGSTIISGDDRHALAAQLVPLIDDHTINARFRERCDLDRAGVLVVTPAARTPDPNDVLALVARIRQENISPPDAARDLRPLIELSPVPGDIAQMSIEPTTGVLTAHFTNGVTLHHRAMSDRDNRVLVSITLAGGRIEETPSTRGLTDAAGALWQSPATCSLSSAGVAAALVGRNVTLTATTLEDSILLHIETDAEDLERALQLVNRLIEEPLLEPPAFERWRETAVAEAEQRATEPGAVLNEAFKKIFYPPNDPRHGWLTADEARTVSFTAAQRWLDELLSRAPIEASIVGDIDREPALRAAAAYLGSIAARDPISPRTLADRRTIPFPSERVDRRIVAPTRTEVGIVFLGFRGPDHADPPAVTHLDLARRILALRLNSALREREQRASSVAVRSVPGDAYPGSGLFWTVAFCEPEQAGSLPDELARTFNDFAQTGPTDDELAVARRSALSDHTSNLEDSDFWSTALATAEYRDRPPSAIIAEARRIENATTDAVRSAFGRFHNPERLMTIVVTPGELGPHQR